MTRFRRSRRLQISLVILAIFLPLALLTLWLGREKAIASWYDDNFSYRQTVAITNSGSSQTDYQIPISLDTATLITAGKMRSDCYDIRVTNYGGDLLPLWIETGTNACNTATTQIWVKVPSVPTPNNVLLIYYGNSTVTTGTNGHGPSSADAGKSVFESFDTFDTLDTSKWTATGSPTVSGGAVALTNGQTLVSSSVVTSSAGLGRIIARVKQAATNLTGGKIGFSNSATSATNFHNDDAAAVILGSTEEQVSQTASTNLVSHHLLEETTSTDANQFKASGYLDTGKLSQAVSVYGNAAGTTGSTLTFNRGSQISGNNYEKINTNQGTISFWVKGGTWANDNQEHGFLGNLGSTFYVYKSTTNLMKGRFDAAATHIAQADVSSWTSTSVWHLVTFRWDADNVVSGSNYLDLWLDGTQYTAGESQTSSWTPPTLDPINFIGSRSDSKMQANTLIDDFAIFDRVLSTTEITALYNSGTGAEAGSVADSALKFYAKMDGSGTLSPVTYNAAASASKLRATSSVITGGINKLDNSDFEIDDTTNYGHNDTTSSNDIANGWSTSGANLASSSLTASVLFDSKSQKLSITNAAAGSDQAYLTQDKTFGSGNYHLSFWYKVSAGSISVRGYVDSSEVIFKSVSSTSWEYVELAFKAVTSLSQIRFSNGGGVQDFYIDNVTLTPNLVDNGGMEGTYSSGVAPGWATLGSPTATAETTTVHSGSESQKIVASAGNQGISQSFSFTTGTWYQISGWVYVSSGTVKMETNSNTLRSTSTAGSWQKLTFTGRYGDSNFNTPNLFFDTTGAYTFYIDDVSVVALDSVATSFQSWTPAVDTATANQLSIQGDSDGVASTTSGARGNGYTFDGATGYLRQKTYDVNIGTLTYADTNTDISDTGQEFEDWDNDDAGSAEYMVVVTNSDNTTSWGYFCANDGGTQTAVYTLKACTGGSEGFNGTSPSGKTPVGYEVRKTDYQITGTTLTFGAWIKPSSSPAWTYFLSKEDSTLGKSWALNASNANSNPSFYYATSGGNDAVTGTTQLSAGNWYFVVGTYDGSNAKIYVNGAQENSAALTGTFTDINTPLILGARANNNAIDANWPGSIDSPFVISSALTASQIQDIYNSTAAHYGLTTNNAVTNTVNANSATPTNDTSYNTITLIAQSSQISVSQGSTGFATNTTNLPNSGMYLRMQNADSSNAMTVDWVAVAKQAATAPTVSAPATEEKGGAPVAYWKFDDGTGTNAQDSSPNNNDGTITGASWQTEDMCVSGKCLKFDGNDYADIPDSSSIDPNYLTFEAWVRGNSFSNSYNSIASKEEDDKGWTLLVKSNGKLALYVEDNLGGTRNYDGTGNTTLATNTWYHLALVYSGTQLIGYVNGVQDATTSFSASTLQNSTYPLRIGKSHFANRFFNGSIDDVKIYNYARTAAQVKADFASRGSSKGSSVIARSAATRQSDALSNGLVGYWKMDESSWTNDCSTASVLDSSGNSNNGKSCPNGTGISTPAAGKFGLSGSFDGSNDYVDAGDPSSGTLDFGTGSFSISFWGKSNITAGVPDYAVGKLLNGTTYDGYHIGVNSSGYGTFIWRTDSTNYAATGTTDLTDNNWHHYVGFRNSSGIYLYVDGALVGSNTNVNTQTNEDNDQPLAIGGARTGDTGELWAGSLDDVRIYNRALSPKEVRDLYNWAPGPVGYWNFEEGSGQSANDTSGNANTGTVTSAVGRTLGKYGKGLGFSSATDDYVSVAASSSLNLGNNLTVEAWVKPSNLSQRSPIFSTRANSDAGSFQLEVGPMSGGTNTLGITTPGVYNHQGPNNVLSTGSWYHIVFTRNGTGVGNSALYVNGVKQTLTTDNPVAFIDNNAIKYIGANSASDGVYPGSIDDVRIYSYARSQKQIVEDMNAGHPAVGSPVGSAVGHWKFDEGQGTTAFNAGNGGTSLNGTLTSMASPATATSGWTQSGKFGKALSFDGSNDYVNIPDVSSVQLTGPLTLSAWVYSSEVTQGANWHHLILKGINGSPWINYGLMIGHITDKYSFHLNIGGTVYTVYSNSVYTPSAWTHVVGVYDGSTMKLFVNGVQQTQTVSITGSVNSTEYFLRLGAWSAGSEAFNGLIDEVKIYNYALTSDEVKTDYNHGVALSLGSLSVNSSNVPLNSSSSSYCIPGDASTCSAPVGEWNFEDPAAAGQAVDSSGNGNTGTWAGTGTHYAPGKLGKGGKFNGSDDYVGVADSTGFTVSSAVTIEYWFNVSQWISDGNIEFDAVNQTNAYITSIDGTGSYLAFYLYGINSPSYLEYDTPLSIGRWYHVSFTYDASGGTGNRKMYLNGALVASDTKTGTIADGGNISLGARGGSVNFLKGSIDQPRVFNYARTPAQVAWDYNRGGPVGWWKMNECQGSTANDSSGNGNTGTITIGATGTQTSVGNCSTSATTAWYTGRTGKYNSSLNFDGTDDYVNLLNGKIDNSVQGTITAWVKKSADAMVFGYGGESFGNYGLFRCGVESGKIFIGQRNNGQNYYAVRGSTSLQSGVWYFLTCLSTGTEWKLYVNGQSETLTITSEANNGNWLGDTTVSGSGKTNVGVKYEDGVYSDYFTGQIDDVQIFNYALTASQIKNLFNENSAVRFGPGTGSP